MSKQLRKPGEWIIWKPVVPTTIDKNLMPRVMRVLKRLEDGRVQARSGNGKSRIIDASEILRPATPREITLGFVPGF